MPIEATTNHSADKGVDMVDIRRTDFDTRVDILAELHVDHHDDEQFEDLITYADLALPLAFALHQGIVEATEKVVTIIDEAFEILLDLVDLNDTGFQDFTDLQYQAIHNLSHRFEPDDTSYGDQGPIITVDDRDELDDPHS
jgi:hypothetical protein